MGAYYINALIDAELCAQQKVLRHKIIRVISGVNGIQSCFPPPFLSPPLHFSKVYILYQCSLPYIIRSYEVYFCHKAVIALFSYVLQLPRTRSGPGIVQGTKRQSELGWLPVGSQAS